MTSGLFRIRGEIKRWNSVGISEVERNNRKPKCSPEKEPSQN